MDDRICMYGHTIAPEDFSTVRMVDGVIVTICADHEAKIIHGEEDGHLPYRFCVMEQRDVPLVRCSYCSYKSCEHAKGED
jgi:hypothetical protein